MYEFYYNNIENKYGIKSKLFITDTNSIMYQIKTEYVYKDFSSNKEIFDFSNYLNNLNHYDNSNKLVIVEMKVKTKSDGVEEFSGFKPTMW